MRTKLLLLLCIFTVTFSCKKNASSIDVPIGSVTAIVDGKQVTLTGAYAAINNSFAPAAYSIDISGWLGAINNSDRLSISISADKPVTTGTYSFSTTENKVGTPWFYYDKPNHITYVDNYNGNNPDVVKITSLTSNNVQGSFSCSLVLAAGDAPQKTVVIENGRFNLKLQ